MSVSVEVKNGKNRYKPSVVENNWFEERADYSLIREDKPLNFNTHLYTTTYGDLSSNVPSNEKFYQSQAVYLKFDRFVAHPGHQPELGPRPHQNDYNTDYMINYQDPKLMKN